MRGLCVIALIFVAAAGASAAVTPAGAGGPTGLAADRSASRVDTAWQEVPRQGAAQEAQVAGGDAPVSRDSAAAAALEARTRDVASQLRCPVCQGLSIEDSPTDLARDMRAVVRDQLASGKTADEVKAYFVDAYGEWILLQPRPSGLNLVVYLLPLLGIGIGAAVILRSVRRWTGRPAPDPADR